MVFTLKSRIWLTVFSIVAMFTFFTLYYFPKQQRDILTDNYNAEVQNLANTVALGVKIAFSDENYEAVDSSMKFVTEDPRLQFVMTLEHDTTWDATHQHFTIKENIFKIFPANEHPSTDIQSNNSLVVARSNFTTSVMSGTIVLAFTKKKINESQNTILQTSLKVSSLVLLVGILLGLILARKISVPVLALRDAASLVGKGDLNQRIKVISNDEIGDLGKAFNNMVGDLSKARHELDENNRTLKDTNAKLSNTLEELKSTQTQLVHSEKMASLGELTAGIAHEIQNPLNFVNNFAEVSNELLEEMKAELAKGNTADAMAIADDVKQNLEKINHHGKRADAIVKGMLQHSRSGSAVKEPTDINALADEYLRLSYHGLRAKDKTFNATLKSDYDKSLGMVNIISQDVGRVILNLLTNAFYAVTEKKKSGIQGYEPTVSVTTKNLGAKVEVRIADNGMGIPQKVMEKIFQPFFTTKPTGQGTGLGLSLSFDIITKGHGGNLKVDTKEGEGTTFIIELPV